MKPHLRLRCMSNGTAPMCWWVEWQGGKTNLWTSSKWAIWAATMTGHALRGLG